MDTLPYVLLGYALCGWQRVGADMRADPLNRPFWAIRPTLGMVLFIGFFWWYAEIAKARRDLRWTTRDVVVGLLGALVRLGVASLLIWSAFAVTGLFLEHWLARVLAAVVVFALGVPLLSPLLAIPMMLVGLIIAAPLNLLFPDKE